MDETGAGDDLIGVGQNEKATPGWWVDGAEVHSGTLGCTVTGQLTAKYRVGRRQSSRHVHFAVRERSPRYARYK